MCLKEVLDRTTLPPIETIPGPENIQSTEGGEPLARWQIPNTQISIARITEGPQKGQYLFTAESLAEAIQLYDRIREQPYRTSGMPVSPDLHVWFLSTPSEPHVAALVESFPAFFKYRRFGLAIWQMLGLTLATAAAIGLMFGLYRYGAFSQRSGPQKEPGSVLAEPAVHCLATACPDGVQAHRLGVPIDQGNAAVCRQLFADIVFLMAAILRFWRLTSRLANSVMALPGVKSREVDATLIRLLFRVLGIVAAVIVFLEGGRYLGFPVTTLLASAGIGGLAIALSAQGTVKGLFGTVAILMDRPYRVGDRIVAKGHDGVVEEIGLRSTKIREFLTNHLDLSAE